MSRHSADTELATRPAEVGTAGGPGAHATAGAIVEAVRLLVTLTITAAGFLAGQAAAAWSSGDPEASAVIGAVVGAGVGYVSGGVLGRVMRRALQDAPKLVARASGPELFAGAFGVAIGVFVGVVVAVPLVVFLPAVIGWPAGGLLVLLLAAFGGRVFAERSRELLATIGLRPRDPLRAARVVPEERTGPTYLVDSSAAVDGRILDLARAGLVSGAVLVPEFIIDELQAIADSGDRSCRRRGRRGLDVLDTMRDIGPVDMIIPEDTVPEFAEVDAKLLALSDRYPATLVTTDHNLAKAAAIRGLQVLNPHALGESLRPALAVGDKMDIAVEKEGSEPGQGVGYLDDGTMVVVEGGSSMVGQIVTVEVANSLRTSVGRLMFARMEP